MDRVFRLLMHFFYLRADHFTNADRVFDAGTGQQMREFLSAISREQISRPMFDGENRLRNTAQQSIAGRVSEFIVVCLEVVHVEHEEGDEISSADGSSPLIV